MNINLGYKLGDNKNYFASLSHNKEEEFFFRILWRDGYVPPIHTEETKNFSIDHISFHKDGNTHFTCRDESGKEIKRLEVTKMPSNPSKIGETFFAPLLILSIYQDALGQKLIGKDTPLIMKMQNTTFEMELQNSNGFSIVPILVGSGVDYKSMLATHFPDVFISSASPMIFNVFGHEENADFDDQGRLTAVRDMGLLIGYTPKTLVRPDDKHFLGFSLFPSDQKINSLT